MVATRVARRIADHDGIITHAEAVELGMTRAAIRTRIDSGAWRRLTPGVYLCGTHDLTGAARLRAAVAVHRAVADRTAAAFWHGMLDDLPAAITLSAPPTVTGRSSAPFATDLVRRELPPEDVETLRGIRVTRRPLTVLLAVALLDDPQAFFDRALQTGQVTVEAVQRAFERNSRRPGIRAALPYLEAASCDSEAESERVFVEQLRTEEIGGWVQQLPFGRWRIDFAWPAEGVAVEISGWAYHRDHDRFESDAAKAAALAAAGWLVLPYTWRQITMDPIGCVEKIVAAIRVRRARLG